MALVNKFIPITPMRSKYTPQEWSAREQEYMVSVNSISIPGTPDTKDIMNLNSAIDQVYTVAKVECAVYERLFDKFDRRRKNSEIEVYTIIKSGLPKDANGNPEKKTETEMKAMGMVYLNNKPADQNASSGYTIYNLLEMAEERYIYMKAIVDLLKDKSDKLITDTGSLKLEVKI